MLLTVLSLLSFLTGIRQLQLILFKVALMLGVEIHVNVEFVRVLEPPEDQENQSTVRLSFSALKADIPKGKLHWWLSQAISASYFCWELFGTRPLTNTLPFLTISVALGLVFSSQQGWGCRCNYYQAMNLIICLPSP